MSGLPARAYVGIGANLGDAQAAIDSAFDALSRLTDTRLVARSSVWKSAPIDSSGPDYLNAVASLDTALPPLPLLEALLDIEARHGRERPYRNAPRTLDLDLLLYGSQTIDTSRLVVPHPRMHERAFVLAPLQELWPQGEVPKRGRIDALLRSVEGQRIERVGG